MRSLTFHREHDPVRDATLYVSGELSLGATLRFESHLLGCETCWHEVRLARGGRLVAEHERDLAPGDLRERVRAVVDLAASERAARTRRRRLRVLIPAVAAVVLMGIAGLVVTLDQGSNSQPRVIQTAVLAYRSDDVPQDPARRPAPNLSHAGLTIRASGHTRMDGVPVDVFAYNAEGGVRVFLYVSSQPFPRAAGARPLPHSVHAWTTRMDDALVVGDDRPHPFLAMGTDPDMVKRAESALTHSSEF